MDASLIASTAYQLAGGNADKAHALAADMVLLAAAVDGLYDVVTFAAEGKFVQEYVGTITKVAGNAVYYDEGDGEERRVFFGTNALSRYAGRVAARNIGKRCAITFGFEPGQGTLENGKKTDSDLRRLVRCVPVRTAQPEQTPAEPEPAAGPERAQRPASTARPVPEPDRTEVVSNARARVTEEQYKAAFGKLPRHLRESMKAWGEANGVNVFAPEKDQLATAFNEIARLTEKTRAA